jgi:hypothetical protein
MAREPGLLERGLILNVPQRAGPDTNQKVLDRMAFLVGLVAVGLPLVMIYGGTIGDSCFRDSISHFYYAQVYGAIFVGLLFFIGGFLIAYSGDHWLETWGSALAGVGAFGVAVFPTSGTGCELAQTFLSRVFVEVTNGPPLTVGRATTEDQDFFALFGTDSKWAVLGEAADVHMIGAGVLFFYLGLYCIVVLRRVIPERHGTGAQMRLSKRRRNRVYALCGLAIWACVAVLGLKGPVLGDLTTWNYWNLTFWVELVALWAFGLAWLTKGRIFAKLNDS